MELGFDMIFNTNVIKSFKVVGLAYFLLFSCSSFSRPLIINKGKTKIQKPIFEAGVGMAWLTFPDYPGSDYYHNLVLPFPTVIYRGKILRSTREEGVRGRFLDTERLELDFSFDGTIPSSSGKNKTRDGMPRLDTVLEFGPRLIVHLFNHNNSGLKGKLDLNIAFRTAIATDLENWNDQGIQFNPSLSYSLKNFLMDDTLLLLFASGKWSTRKLLKYYYGVDKQYSRVNRPAYHAESGYFETTLAAFISIPFYKKFSFFTGIVNSYYQNATNRGSPLLVNNRTSSYVVGLNWMLYKSKKLIWE